MSTMTTVRPWLRLAHRWLGLIFFPLFMIILLSGAVLALKPIVDDLTTPAVTAPVESGSVLQRLTQLDPQGQASSLRIEGGSIELNSRGAGPQGRFALADGQVQPGGGVDVFAVTEQLHKNLLLGLGVVVEWASWAMLAIVVCGPLLGWLRLRNTLLGWHMAAGWLLLPLIAIGPITAALMILHIGGPQLPPIAPARPALSLSRGLELAAAQVDLSGLHWARSFRAGSVLLEVGSSAGAQRYIVDGGGSVHAAPASKGLVSELHEGTWGGAWSGAINLLAALTLSGLSITGFWSWLRRKRQAGGKVGAAEWLVAHASQTGTAARLAAATADALRQAGYEVACASLAALSPADLERYRGALLLVSTTGEGDVAEPGRRFVSALHGARTAARFSLLELGDRRYAHFCGGGETVRSALLAAGASEAVPAAQADGEPVAAWSEWFKRTQTAFGIEAASSTAVAMSVQDAAVSLKLIERERLDDPESGDTAETWRVCFGVDTLPDCRPGDLLLLAPAANDVERCYSLGRIEREGRGGRLTLTVGLKLTESIHGEPHYGRMSYKLCRELAQGVVLQGKLRRHPGFNPPAIGRPMIMIAAGCGIAPFPGFIAERAGVEGAGASWLLFGNRHFDGDFLYGRELTAWRDQGVLTRLDTAFSRDAGGCHYVPDAVREQAEELLRWLVEDAAVLYVCGRSRLGDGVERALIEALQAHRGFDSAAAQAQLQDWRAAGRLHFDLFD
ncbi:PepSY domain-containing protein [Plasticicumulans acidivorans]|uniref:NADPH--hemoprotein reductase n=1 Tax=Plasticicumulans acidivorans TaxID=886464 RepID=A0A317MSB8_9GAMM|nr:PepSY domain-containing protein [Plasticicumulans acidivorans]PWV59901.1 sulfite reductase (NADPH) flavoprotein alpha-component [Plasticicumulans acidivorans]